MNTKTLLNATLKLLGTTIVFCVLAVLALKLDGAFGNPVSERPADKQLLLAFVVNRHGDRTPAPEEVDLSTCKEKLKKAIEMEGYEALTITGKRRAFQIGKYLRQRYGSNQGFDLLSKIFYPKQIYVRSTFKYRAQMTAQIAMSALYPPEPAQQWDTGVGAIWQPVPYTMVPQKEDYLRYYSTGVCSRFDELMAQAQVDGLNDEFAQFNDLVPIIKQNTGVNFTEDLLMYQSLLDLFKSQIAYGFDVPEWAKPILPRLNEAGRLAYRLYNRNDEMKKIGGGVLLSNFVQISDKIISRTLSNDTARVHMFSSHDFNVGAFMDVSMVDDNITQTIPDYASVYSLELYRSADGAHYVLPVYLPQAGTSVSKRLRIRGCDDYYCEFNKFKSMTEKYLLPESEYFKLCNVTTSL